MQRSLANADGTAVGAKRDQSALASERDAYVRGWKADASQKLQEISVKAANTHELLNKAKLRRNLVELRAGQMTMTRQKVPLSMTTFHVLDIVDAHLRALNYFIGGASCPLNLANERAYSVKVITTAERLRKARSD
jgi:hypothetical protein